MKKQKIIRVLAVMLLALNILPTIVSVKAVNDFCGYDFPYSYPGVSGTIRTRDHDPPANEFGCEWVMIVLSYANEYYIQVGYSDGDAPDGRNWFYELRDIDNTSPVYLAWVRGATPAVGTTFYYEIDSPTGGWDITCKYGSTTIWSSTKTSNPSTYSGLQALCETTDTDVTIDGSRFRDLSYYTTAGGGDWRLWDTYTAVEDSPYSLTELEEYEFNADGGGD